MSDVPSLDYATAPFGRRRLLPAIVRNPIGLACLIYLALLLVVAVFAPVLTPYSPSHTDLNLANAPVGSRYLLGGDASGRDILSRLMASATVTVEAALIATLVAVVLGVVAGLVAGYFGGAWDATASWVANVLMTIPGVIVLIALYAAIGPSLLLSMSLYGVLLAPAVFRLVRGLVRGVRNELYIDAARVSGLSDRRIMRRHILVVVRTLVIIQAAFVAESGITIQAGLEFLGLGDPGVPSWGVMLRDAFASIYTAPVQIVWPALALTLTVAALVLLGNVIRDALSPAAPRARARRRKPGAPLQPAAVIADEHATIVAEEPDLPEYAAPRVSAVLGIADLHVAYPDALGGTTEVVSGVSLRVDRGEILGLVGQSGSGKTQTAFAALGILPSEAQISRGSITVAGVEVVGATPSTLVELRRGAISYVPQEPMSNLDPSFKVGTQLAYGIRAATGMSRSASRTLILDLFDRVGIRDPARTFASYPHEISGGMAQRALIAGAIATDPQVLIADEPTTALDVTVQAEILDLLRDLQAERRMAVLLVTHNFGVVADLCDRVAVMESGRIVEEGGTRELFAMPRHPYTQRLLASMLDDEQLRPPRTVDRGRS
jgi:peptide/nickel transport system permease protein